MADLGAIGASYGLGSLRGPNPSAYSSYARPSARQTAVPSPRPLMGRGFVRYRVPTAVPGTPSWAGGPRPVGAEPAAVYAVGGTVKQRLNGVDSPLANCLVRLYARRTGMPAGAALTGLDGSFRVGNLLPETAGFFAIAFDPDGAPVQNALIFDRLQALPSVPGRIRNTAPSFTVDVAVSLQLTTAYLVGAPAFSVSSGALPDGVALSSSGLLSGTPTTDGEAYSFTITATGSIYGTASVTWSGEVAGGIGYLNTLNGRTGLNNVWSGQVDDSNTVLPALPFQFPLFGLTFQNNIYISSNSHVDFGFGSSAYSGLSPTNPGRALLINAADRSYQNVFAGPVLSGACFLIRYEGSSNTGNSNDNLWEVGLYNDGSITVVTGTVPGSSSPNGAGTSNISDGTAWRSVTPPTFLSNRAYLGQPTGPGGDFVWTEITP